MTVVDNGTDLDLTALAATDRRVARDLSAAERDRITAAQRIAAADAAAERQLRKAEGRLHLDDKRDQIQADRRARRKAQREADRQARRARRAIQWATRKAQLAGLVSYVRDNAASVYSSVIYGLAVSGAVYGQIDAARGSDVPTLFAIAASIAIEGCGLAMALTAQQQRLSRERALAARALVWGCTALAVAINYRGHIEQSPVMAYILSALSALGIVVFEIRSGAKHRQALRAAGMIPEPGEQFGLRWLAYPRSTFAAWRLGLRDRLSPGAAALVARVEQARDARRVQRALAGVERRRQADAAAAAKRRRKLTEDVARGARRALREAKGKPGVALAALVQLAHTGTPAPLLALPSPARADVDAARRAQADAEAVAAAATARADAEAAARADAEAEAATVRADANAAIAAVRADADAAIAAARADVDAARRAQADAEAHMTASGRTLRAETSARADADAVARSAIERADAEAARAARAEGAAEVAERAVAGLRRQLADEQQSLVQAQARAVAAEQVLAGERENFKRADQQRQQAAADEARQLAAANEQVAALQAELAEVRATLGRRASRQRSATPATAAPAEPVLFHGQAIPAVDGASATTALKILTAYEADPTATRAQLAEVTGTNVRSVRRVLSAASDLLNTPNSNGAIPAGS
jgi:hypothetical protein